MASKRIFTKAQTQARGKRSAQSLIIRNRYAKRDLGLRHTPADYRAMIHDACILTDETINDFHVVDVRLPFKTKEKEQDETDGLGQDLT